VVRHNSAPSRVALKVSPPFVLMMSFLPLKSKSKSSTPSADAGELGCVQGQRELRSGDAPGLGEMEPIKSKRHQIWISRECRLGHINTRWSKLSLRTFLCD
jgi:hypothetical protein